MRSGLVRRLARLEAERGSGKGCPECGEGGPGPTVFRIRRPKVFGDPPDERDDTSRDFCGTCGRRVVFRVPSPKLMPWAGLETRS